MRIAQPPTPSPRRVFFFIGTASAEIYTLSLHDALPILGQGRAPLDPRPGRGRDLQPALRARPVRRNAPGYRHQVRSEEHTSELQSQSNLVCRLLLEKKKYLSSRKRGLIATEGSPPQAPR